MTNKDDYIDMAFRLESVIRMIEYKNAAGANMAAKGLISLEPSMDNAVKQIKHDLEFKHLPMDNALGWCQSLLEMIEKKYPIDSVVINKTQTPGPTIHGGLFNNT